MPLRPLSYDSEASKPFRPPQQLFPRALTLQHQAGDGQEESERAHGQEATEHRTSPAGPAASRPLSLVMQAGKASPSGRSAAQPPARAQQAPLSFAALLLQLLR